LSKIGAYGLIFLFVCLNLGAYLLNEFQVLGDYRVEPYETPTTIQEQITDNLVLHIVSSVGVGGIIGFITGNLVYGGTASLVIFSLSALFPVVRWVIGGFPLFLSQLGAPTEIVLVISVLTGIVWFWTLFSVLSGRAVERE